MMTGRKRYRVLKRFLRSPVLVLQVEVREMVLDRTGYGEYESRWVDARVEHLTVEQDNQREDGPASPPPPSPRKA